jgi:SAM-dependent methyltransferase
MDRKVYDRMNELETRHWWFVARRRIIAALVTRRLQGRRDARILEAGCGSGGNLAMLGGFGQVDAFEYDAFARDHARAKSGLPVEFGALPDGVPFDDRRYDLIGLFDVLEHIEADRASLATLADRLSDRGAILVTVPAFPFLWSRHDERHHHFRRYTRASLDEVARAAGLRVSYSSYFNFFLFPAAVTARFLKRLTGSEVPDDRMPAAPVNAILTRVFGAERHLVGRMRLPLGLSLAAVLEKA